MKIKLILSFILVVVFSALCYAQKDQTKTDSNKVVSTDMQGEETVKSQYNLAMSIFRLVFALLLVIAMAVVLVIGLKWLQSRKIGKSNPDWIKTVGIFPLGPKQYIYLVQMMNRYMLLGVTEAGISILTELDESEAQQIDKHNFKHQESFKEALAKQLNIFSGRGGK